MSVNLSDALTLFLDSTRLSEAVGAPRVATRVRIKPGVSISASLADADGHPVGWARLLWPDAVAKGKKSATKAQRRGLPTSSRTLDGGLWLQWGDIDSDPDLMFHIVRAQASGVVEPRTWQVLRHNPLRRLVARSGGAVVRIQAVEDAHVRGLDAFLSEVVPVPERLDDGSDPHVSLLADAGGFDLSQSPCTAGQVRFWHEDAGGIFARLHAAVPSTDLAQRLGAPTASTRHTLAMHARIIGSLNAVLGARIEALAATAPEPADAPLVPIHADATPDQVLVSADGTVLLTDFDRARMGAASLDVASYMVGTDLECAEAFARGYERAGGRLPEGAGLSAARIHARALKLADPLREARPDWAQRIDQSLTLIEEESACL